jgi:hypothetical protein
LKRGQPETFIFVKTSGKVNSKIGNMKLVSMFVIVTLLFGITGFRLNDKKEAKAKKQFEMAQLIESGHFKFVAQSATSDMGTFNNLSPNYDLVFDSLHIKAYLPYYGRAFSAKYWDPDGGVKFDLNADKIDKTYNERKKLYLISVELKDSNDMYKIFLSAGLDGYADVRVNFLNRQWISYYGMIEKN